MEKIQMVDLQNQYLKIKDEIDTALLKCTAAAQYIKGPEVKQFEDSLAKYLGVNNVIAVGNGTDALQIALMALDLKPGDEIIVPAFTYVATAEAIALLKLTPVMVDVDYETFNISIDSIKKVITQKTKAIVPVHLFGQSADMEPIIKIANELNIFIIEDNAQALGAEYIMANGEHKKTGSIGHIACHSFFPTKNLGCFGDGGAISTNNPELAEKCRMIASHGQKKKYYHEIVGCNSRLDTLQASILLVKLKYLDDYIVARQKAAEIYYNYLNYNELNKVPFKTKNSVHTFNQFTLKVKNNKRDALQQYLLNNEIPTIIYYPLPLYKQNAFKQYCKHGFELPNTENLCKSVLSIPMHTELTIQTQEKITKIINTFN